MPDQLVGSGKVLKCPKCQNKVDLTNSSPQAAQFDDEPASKCSGDEIDTPPRKTASRTVDDDDEQSSKNRARDDDEDPPPRNRNRDNDDVDHPKSKRRSRDDDEDDGDHPKSKRRSRDDDEDDDDQPKSKRRSRDDDEPATKKRKRDDHDEDNERETRRDERFSAARTIPVTVQLAGIMWIVLGALFLIAVVGEGVLLSKRAGPQGADAKSSPSAPLGLAMGIGFIIAGVRIRQGKSADTLVASILSILAGALYTGIGILALGVRRGPAELVELLHMLAMISLFLGTLLVLAGVLALAGRSQYKDWFAAQRRSRRDGDYRRPRRRRDFEDDEDRDDDNDDEDRPRRRRSNRDDR